MNISVSAPSGLEGVTKREIYNLTGENLTAINGRLTTEGDIKKVALFNLNLRTASRVFIVIGSFKATTFDELFDGVSSLNFEEKIFNLFRKLVYSSSNNSS